MREIKIYKFSELDAEQQKKAIAINSQVIENEVYNYLTEIWPDFIEELNDDMFDNMSVFSVIVTSERVVVTTDFSKVDDAMLSMNGDKFKEYLTELVKIQSDGKWFSKDVTILAEKYLAMEYPTLLGFVAELVGKVEGDVNNFYVNMLHNVEFVYNYVNGKADNYYVIQDFLDMEYEFYDNGHLYDD